MVQILGVTAQHQPQLQQQNNHNFSWVQTKSKVRILGNIENVSCSTILVDPKTVVEPNP